MEFLGNVSADAALECCRALADAVDEGIYQLDADGRFVAVDDVIVEMTGYTRDDLLGEHFSLVFDEDEVEWIEDEIRSRLEADDSSVGPLGIAVETATGERMPCELQVGTLRDGGEFLGTVGVVRDVTERKRAEAELRRSEERFRNLMERSPFSIQIFDAEGRTIAANPAWERLWDASRSELADYNVLEDEQLEATGILSSIRGAFEGEVVTLPVTHYDPAEIGKPGRDRWIEGYVYPLLPGDEQSFEVAIVHHDATARKEREEELQRYEMAVETVWDGITILDSDDRFVLVNEAFCEITGYDHEEIIGEHATLILDESTYEQAGRLHDEVVEGNTDIATLEYDLLTATGRTVPVEARFGPVKYVDGTVGGAGVIRDISERRERERELERALDLLEKTEHIANVGGWEIDADTRELFWTDHVFELLEVTSEGEPSLEAALARYCEKDRPIVDGAIEDALESGAPFDVEARYRTDDEEVRWLRMQGDPETVDGEVVSLRGATQDVTERKLREKQFEELIDRLEESNQRLEQFAYAASHDLQEPLRMVTSYLKLIDQRYSDTLDEGGKEFLEFAVDGADRMREMIQSLLQYSRVDTQGNPMESVELDRVLAGVRDDLRMKLAESDAELTVDDLPCVRGDRGQLRQVFQNLLDNAIEYSGEEPPHVEVGAERKADKWVFRVADNGIGIDPADADRIFEVFQRLHSTDEHSGTGIGLALCQRIVERHGGDIWIESEPGEGSTVSFTLPASENERPA